MGRATGKILCGGGLLRDVPVFHEAATCGESLGDMIGGADTQSAAQRWEHYANESVIGSGVYSLTEDLVYGNEEHADELRQGMSRARSN